MKNILYLNAIESLGVVETNIWLYNGVQNVAGGATVTNPKPIQSPLLGSGRVCPFKVPQQHVLIVTSIFTGEPDRGSGFANKWRMFVDSINGATTLAIGGSVGNEEDFTLPIPLIVPADYLVGFAFTNFDVAAQDLYWAVTGYLARTSTSGRPTIGDRGLESMAEKYGAMKKTVG